MTQKGNLTMLTAGLLTSRDLMSRCGFENQKTLTRWCRLALIPPPTIATHPSGRGKISYWESWVVRRIKEVQNRQQNGETLEQIARTLGSDWAREKKRLGHKSPAERLAHPGIDQYLAKVEAAEDFAESCCQRVLMAIESMGMRRPADVSALAQALANPALVDEAIELVREGHSPVLAILGKELRMLPCFLLSSALAQPEMAERPILVVPIHSIVVEAFSVIDSRLRKRPKFLPVTRVVEFGSKPPQERKYHHKTPWKFEFDD